jgi:ABC-type amino acid transport substrate-binding protein
MLRAGVNLGNPVLAVRDPATGELRGVAIDIARELAARVAVPLRFVTYDSAARMAEEAPSGAWDMAFLGADPAREADITFTYGSRCFQLPAAATRSGRGRRRLIVSSLSSRTCPFDRVLNAASVRP